MKTKILGTLFFFAFFFVSVSTYAQLWEPITVNKINTLSIEKEFRKTVPTDFKLFGINSDQLKSILDNAPSGKTQKQNGSTIQLPTEDGNLQSFSLVEASILGEELAKKYPNIKSYIAYGIDDPTATARISMSSVGMHAMISSGNHSTIYIDPYSKDKKYYISYAKSDLPADVDSFSCMVKESSAKEFEPEIITKNANDGKLRTFRLAVACTGEYSQFHINNQGISSGASTAVKKGAVLSAINTTMTRVNGIFERDMAIRMILVNNNADIIFLNPSTDNLTNNSASSLINESQTVCDNFIGFNNYDIGHAFSTGGGGLAQLRSPCTGSKARGITGSGSPIGDSYDVDYVAHEMGHQFGANHTQNNSCQRSSRSVEPGSASTIMGYAGICNPNVQNNSDAYFHAISIQEMWANIASGNSTCGDQSNTNNDAPSANAGPDYTIPKSTPFVLEGNGSDPNSGNSLTYCWEQMDTQPATMPPSSSSTGGPAFRSLNPTSSPDRYMPALSTVKNGQTASTWEVVPSVGRTMNFRLTVRDNVAGGGSTASDNMRVTVAGGAGPFVVTAPNSNVSWEGGSTKNITWNVAGTTGNGVNTANVDILLSTDGGNTYPTTIVSAVPNDGSQNITVPNVPGNQNRIMVKGSGNIFYDISNANFTITQGTGSDTEAPSVPGSLTASNVTQSSIQLGWNASNDNVGVTGYDIYRGNTIIGSATSASYTATGLTANTSYSFRVKAKDAAGNTSNFSNTATATTLPGTGGDECTGGVSSFPYSQGFGNSIGDWIQGTGDDFNWSVNSGGTPSRNTGPSAAAGGNFYVYMESSDPNYPNKRAILNSPCFDLSSAPAATFNFQYHMYGSSAMGSLKLEVSDDNGASWSTVWSKSGNQGNAWNVESINLSAYVGSSIRLRFNGITGTTWQGDMAIDSINLTTDTPDECTDIQLSITFDRYPEDISWTITDSNNDVVASGENYDNLPSQSIIAAEECLAPGTYTFTLNDSYGDGLCCRWGNGSYALTASDGTTLASGATFGSRETTNFTINGSGRTNDEAITINRVQTTEQIQYSLSPNPLKSGDLLQVIAPRTEAPYTIYDMLGKSVKSGMLTQNTINVDELQLGLYILKVNINNRPIIMQFIKR